MSPGATREGVPVLRTYDLTRRFGGLVATDRVSLTIERGARHALIGPNGAGKTTLVNLLSGQLEASAGRIELDGVDITRERPHRRVARGLVRTFQISQLFRDLTPLHTLLLAIAQREGRGARFWRPLGSERAHLAEAIELLEGFGLAPEMHQRTAILAYGKRRLLEIAIALAARPRVLLLDEPAAGVPDAEREDILATIARLPEDVSVVLIEHDMDLVFSFATRISVLVSGALLVDDTPQAIAADPRVREVYLGESGGAPPAGAAGERKAAR